MYELKTRRKPRGCDAIDGHSSPASLIILILHYRIISWGILQEMDKAWS